MSPVNDLTVTPRIWQLISKYSLQHAGRKLPEFSGHRQWPVITGRWERGCSIVNRQSKACDERSERIGNLAAARQHRRIDECSERSRQSVENKDEHFSHSDQSRQVTENKWLIFVKPSDC